MPLMPLPDAPPVGGVPDLVRVPLAVDVPTGVTQAVQVFDYFGFLPDAGCAAPFACIDNACGVSGERGLAFALVACMRDEPDQSGLIAQGSWGMARGDR